MTFVTFRSTRFRRSGIQSNDRISSLGPGPRGLAPVPLADLQLVPFKGVVMSDIPRCIFHRFSINTFQPRSVRVCQPIEIIAMSQRHARRLVCLVKHVLFFAAKLLKRCQSTD